MSDSTTQIPQVSQNASQREVTQNEINNEAAPSMLFARLATTAALTWAFQGGRHNGTQFANGTVALTASNTNYVVAHKTTLAVTASTSITNWNDTATYGRCYLVVAGVSTITSYEDHRSGTNGILSGVAGSSGAVPTGTGFRHITSGSEDAAAVAVDLSGAHATGIMAAARMPALTGDVTNSAGAVATTIANDAVTNAKLANMATATFKGRTTGGTGDPEDLSVAQAQALLGITAPPKVIQVACSDQTTALTTGTAKVTFRMPYAMTVSAVRASLNTASSSGTPTIDINEGGTTILSTKLTIDASELTSTTAATPAVISDSALADDAEITIDIDVAGTGAKGLVVTIIGT